MRNNQTKFWHLFHISYRKYEIVIRITNIIINVTKLILCIIGPSHRYRSFVFTGRTPSRNHTETRKYSA